MRPSDFRERIYKPALKAAGLPMALSPHRLRHSAGDHMREAGEALETIQKRLRHASIDAMYSSARGHFADMPGDSETAT